MEVPVIYPPPDGAHLYCELCSLHFYPIGNQRSSGRTYQMSVDDDEAQEMITSRLSEAKNDIDYVKEKLETHGDLLVSRWSKRSRDKRGKLLSDAAGEVFGAWPRVGPTHSPGFVENCKARIGTERWNYIERLLKSRACDGCWFGRWLKITDLTEDRLKLLMLLHVRTSYSAQDWTIFDLSQNASTWESTTGKISFNAQCVRICGNDFGRLETFDRDLVHARAIIGFPRAYTTVMGQKSLARALRKVVDAIVMESPATGNSKWLKLMTGANGLQGTVEEGRWSSYVHPGFAPPSGLDIDALLQASSDRYNQIADEMELIQADPQYTYNCVLTMKAGINWDENVPSSLKWAYVSETLFHNRAMSLVLWQILIHECRSFQSVCRAHEEENHTSAIQPGSYMPTAVRDAFKVLCATVQSRQVVQKTKLGRAITDMDAMKRHNKRRMVDGKLSNVFRSEESQNLDLPSDRIAVASRAVQGMTVSSGLYSVKHELDVLADELSLVQSNQRTDDEFSSLALIDAMRMSTFWCCQAIVEPTYLGPSDMPSPVYNNPKPRSNSQSSKSSVLSDLRAGALEFMESVERDRGPPAPGPIGKRLGPLLREFCDNPWPKNGSGPVWLEKATKSRQLLSAIWQALRDEWSTLAINSLDKTSINTIVATDMSFDTSPRYLAMVDEERKAHQRGPTTATPKTAASQQQLLQSTWGSENTHTGPVRRNITRAKLEHTRVEELAEPDLPTSSSQQNEPMLQESVLQESVLQEPTAPRISVKQESLSVFNKMFTSGGTSSIRWIQLVQALTDAGMTATQVPGSGVKFSNGRESIVLHKPHPEPVVDGVMLRCQIGRRLQKWFSWDKETFVLRVKNVEEEKGDVDNN